MLLPPTPALSHRSQHPQYPLSTSLCLYSQVLLDPHTARQAGDAPKLPLLQRWLRHSLCLLHPQAALSLPAEPRIFWNVPCTAAAIPTASSHTGCRLHSTSPHHGGSPAAKAEQRHYVWTAWERHELGLISTAIFLTRWRMFHVKHHVVPRWPRWISNLL